MVMLKLMLSFYFFERGKLVTLLEKENIFSRLEDEIVTVNLEN